VVVSPPEGESTPTFEAFYAAQFARLFRLLVMLSGDRAEAEDLTHEAFVRLLERWESVSRMEAPEAYLFRTALNLERNRLRRLLRRPRRWGDDREVERDFAEDVVSREHLLALLQRLSRGQREAIVLVDMLGMTSDVAARIASVRADALRARLHRARAALRRELTDDG
jgi:RNA polymerase sigma-70 factor (ECF subfamily)